MRKTICLIIAFIFIVNKNKLLAQNQSDSIVNATAFPLGLKMTLKLIKSSQNSYSYKVIEYSEFNEQFKISEIKNLFRNEPEKETIEVVFGIGFYNEGKEVKDYQTVMLLRNNYSKSLQFDAKIKIWNKDDFEKTSINPINPGTKHFELWPYKIDFINITNFRDYSYK